MILICEDNSIQRGAVAELLRREGYRVREAASVKEAIKKIEEQFPKVLVLDLVMPDNGGESLAMAIKSDPLHKDTKIVVTTGLPREDVVRVPADAVITKPFSIAQLDEAIEKLAPLEKERNAK